MKKWRFSVWLWGGVIALVCLLPGTHATTAQGQAMLTLTPLEVGVAETGVIEGRIDCGTTGCGGFKLTLSFDFNVSGSGDPNQNEESVIPLVSKILMGLIVLLIGVNLFLGKRK